MSQKIEHYFGTALRTLRLPDSSDEVLPGMTWGNVEQPFTPAFWAAQAFLNGCNYGDHDSNFRLGRSFKEEAVACLLGGYGIPAEVGLAAFSRLQALGMLDGATPSEAEVYDVLKQPLQAGDRQVRYRFARQKSHYVASLLRILEQMPTGMNDRQLRDWLLRCPGIGLKTASWIVRNWRGSDEVAIIDVHLHRAGLLSGFFLPRDTLPQAYLQMEDRYLQFASAIGVRAALLDAIIWQQMRRAGKLVQRMLNEAPTSQPVHTAA